jgi:uncharacterized membrane protein
VADLIVVGFKKDMYRASKVLNELIELNDDWAVDLHGAVAAYRDHRGKLRVDRGYQMLANFEFYEECSTQTVGWTEPLRLFSSLR